jgi:DNA topoisomerase I
MSKNLVIVESPAKAKTIKKYLGKNFTVLASYGHVRDLKPKSGAVDPDNDFAMQYEAIKHNEKHVAAIVKALKDAEALYLATDPDREGEAISWHLLELMKTKKALKKAQKVYRVVFHEITKRAIAEAVEHPREISSDLVDAQQARRALDYLVGFNLSPLLWKKIRRGLSAGRVQSPALRMIVEREEEIEKFKPQEYWTIDAHNQAKQQKFMARLTEYNKQKVTQFFVDNEKQAHSIEKELLQLAGGKLKVIKVDKKQRKRNPAAPFTTSTLQQEAARKLGYTAQRTMRIAQQLYEGIDIGEDTVGLITYMRTDSVNLAQEAIDDIRGVIKERFGENNLPEQPRFYKTKSKNAQEAHEAVRPTSCQRGPEMLEKYLNKDQLKLYTLIWKRTVACQMIPATLDTVAIDLACGNEAVGNTFRANGSTITDPGFISVYREDVDDEKKKDTENTDDNPDAPITTDSEDKILPALEVGDVVELLNIASEQHFTEPPPRYSEASLIKTLEEYGIGRPSTYASIIDTLLTREYVTLETKRFRPTDVGRIVNKFLTTYFTQYVDYDFTAKLEDELDEVARGENKWLPLLKEFWKPFKKQVDNITETVQRSDVTQEAIEEKCPECGKPMVIRLGRMGKFIGCTGYPECKYTSSLSKEQGGNEKDTATAAEAEIIADRKCPQCNSDLQIKFGRYGRFIGCTGYPNCKFIEPLEKPKDMGVQCPECKKGSMLKRKSRRGKFFYSCSRYPDCKYAIWNEPINEKCPKCGWPILSLRITKKRGTEKVCPQKECGYVEGEKE